MTMELRGHRIGPSADLIGADLRRANLSGANLNDADLIGASLSEASLTDADLRHANLSGANLMYADLTDADLRHANLSGANLMYADLTDANLRHANLSGANLSGANMMYANLIGASLSGANLNSATGIRFAAVGWTGHGEASRVLLVVADQDGPGRTVYHCGCFRGSRTALRWRFIRNGPRKFRASRREALAIVDALIHGRSNT